MVLIFRDKSLEDLADSGYIPSGSPALVAIDELEDWQAERAARRANINITYDALAVYRKWLGGNYDRELVVTTKNDGLGKRLAKLPENTIFHIILPLKKE